MKNEKYVLIILFTLQLLSCSKFPDLGNGYRFDYSPNDDISLLTSNNTVIVKGNIERYNFDTSYIIIEEKPRELILKNTYDDPNMNLKKREKIFKKSTVRQYWIINKTNDSVYGPLKKEEYLKKREELKLPNILALEKE